jgi:hypothetical protein
MTEARAMLVGAVVGAVIGAGATVVAGKMNADASVQAARIEARVDLLAPGGLCPKRACLPGSGAAATRSRTTCCAPPEP